MIEKKNKALVCCKKNNVSTFAVCGPVDACCLFDGFWAGGDTTKDESTRDTSTRVSLSSQSMTCLTNPADRFAQFSGRIAQLTAVEK